MDIRVSEASSVIIHHVDPENAADFLEWQRNIAAAAAQLPGYQATDVYPPVGSQLDWVVIVHFATAQALQAWLASPQRTEWLGKLHNVNYEVKSFPGGFGAWFTQPGSTSSRALPPSWKMVLSVLLALYPTAMLLAIFLSPIVRHVSLAAAILMGNVLSLCILQWGVMPVLERALSPWLRSSGKHATAVTVWGTVGIVLAPILMAIGFHFAYG